MILPITRQDVRAMHGSAAALPILAILADEPGMGFSLDFLATATGYESRPALVKACRLLQLLRLADFEETRPNGLRNIRLTAALQLPLPSTHTLTAGEESPLTGGRQPDSAGALVPVRNSRENFSRENFSHVVVGVVNQLTQSLEEQQQQTPARNSHERWRVAGALKALGVWPAAASGLQDCDLADVLGWIAYVSDPANHIRNKPALVANSLHAQRPPAPAYRPFRVCQACRRIETVCECETPDPQMPAEFDLLAIQPPAPSWGETAEDWLKRRWYCPTCFGFPCQCQFDDAGGAE